MKFITVLIISLLSFSCVTTKITNRLESSENIKSNPVDFRHIKNSSIDIYSSDNITEKTEGYSVSQNIRPNKIVDVIVESFREIIPTVSPKYGVYKLPSIYSGKITFNSKEEMKDFLRKSESDYVFIVQNVSASESTNMTSTTQGSFLKTNSTGKVTFELWDVNKQSIVLDLDIEQTNNANINSTLRKAVEYINNEGIINK